MNPRTCYFRLAGRLLVWAALVGTASSQQIAQQAYVKASNTGSGDQFGMAVAISGDTMVVGAPLEDSSASGVNGNQNNNTALDSGAVCIFVRTGTNWVQQAYQKASNPANGNWFGFSVAISGDTVLGGSIYESSSARGVNGNQNDSSAYWAGAAYVFVRNGTNWSQQAYLKASNTTTALVFPQFGFSVAVSGDTAVVGAIGEPSSSTGVNGDESDQSAYMAGAAYVFVRNGSTWTQQAYLKASNTDARDMFGSSVAIAGETVVVGAPEESSNATGVNGDGSNNSAADSGAAYVFVRNGIDWTQQAYLKASNTDRADEFGSWVSLSDDTLVVGAIAESSSATGVNGDQTNNSVSRSGASYVFVRNGTA